MIRQRERLHQVFLLADSVAVSRVVSKVSMRIKVICPHMCNLVGKVAWGPTIVLVLYRKIKTRVRARRVFSTSIVGVLEVENNSVPVYLIKTNVHENHICNKLINLSAIPSVWGS